jgi:uncharacterized coiled-coil DUF342 family protein
LKVVRKEKCEKILEFQKKIRALNEKKTDGNLQQVEKEIRDIDWKIQTTSLTLEEELTLVNRVRHLEAQLSVQKQIKKLNVELLEQKSAEKNLGIEAKTLHEKLSKLAERSQKFHGKMLEAFNKARELQVEADEAHQRYLVNKRQAQKLHQKCVEIVEKIRTMKRDLKQKADKKKAERQSEIQKELEKRALTKLKRGEKLLWEEFQILTEKGIL